MNALADATKEQQVAELDYLGVVASHLPDDVARRRLGQLASEGRDGTLEGSLSDALSFLRNSTEAKRAYVLQFDGDPAASQTANLREEVTAVLKTADASRGDEVVLKLTTGGGTVTGYGLAAAQLLRLKDAGLKLTVCVEQVAASGGYMMACCGDRIIASPFAVLGSIGVITDIPNAYERLKQEGIEFQTVTAGDFKRTVTPTKKVTKEDLAKTEADIKEIFSLFKTFVKGQRPSLDIEKVATGETWFGQDALDRHLCDELRTFDDVKLDLFEAGAEVLQVSYAPPPNTPLEALLQPAGSSSLARTGEGGFARARTSLHWTSRPASRSLLMPILGTATASRTTAGCLLGGRPLCVAGDGVCLAATRAEHDVEVDVPAIAAAHPKSVVSRRPHDAARRRGTKRTHTQTKS